MDATTIIVYVAGFCIVVFAVVVTGLAFYGMLVWYPRQRQKSIDAKKAAGRQGEATILRLPNFSRYTSSRSLYRLIIIALEIRVPGIETYEVEKAFLIPTGGVGLLEEGKIVPVWVDPKEPRNLDKIVIDIQ